MRELHQVGVELHQDWAELCEDPGELRRRLVGLRRRLIVVLHQLRGQRQVASCRCSMTGRPSASIRVDSGCASGGNASSLSWYGLLVVRVHTSVAPAVQQLGVRELVFTVRVVT